MVCVAVKVKDFLVLVGQLIRKLWKFLNEHYLRSALGTVVGTFLLICVILFFLSIATPSSPTNLESIKLNEGEIQDAQKEMEILSNFLISNGQQIIMIREGMVGILIAMASYILKEQLKKDGIDFSNKKFGIFLFMFFIFLSALVIESVIEVTQTALTNRVYQLDNSINEEILRPCSNQLQDVFAPKERFYYNASSISGLLLRLIKAPTFSFFYLFVVLFIVVFPIFLKKQASYIYPKRYAW